MVNNDSTLLYCPHSCQLHWYTCTNINHLHTLQKLRSVGRVSLCQSVARMAASNS